MFNRTPPIAFFAPKKTCKDVRTITAQHVTHGSCRLFNTYLLREQLLRINPSPSQRLPLTYLFSNEYNWNSALRKLNDFRSNNPSTRACAILVGESYAVSILPEMSRFVSSVIFNDIDIKVHQNLQVQFQLLVQVKTKKEFAEKYFLRLQEFLASEIPFDSWQFQLDLERLVNQLPELHFLSSESRFQECKEAAKRIRIYYSHCDLFDMKQILQLSQVLYSNRLKLAVLNVSNVRDYDLHNRMNNTLEPLLHVNPIIMRSTAFVTNKPGQIWALDPILGTHYREILKTPSSQFIDTSQDWVSPATNNC